MFRKWLNFLSAKNQQQKQKIDNVFSILISINNKLEPKIELSIHNKKDGIEQDIAQTIYAINNGLLLSNMVLMLEKYNQSDSILVQDAIYYLNELYDVEFSKKPLVKPTEAFLQSKK